MSTSPTSLYRAAVGRATERVWAITLALFGQSSAEEQIQYSLIFGGIALFTTLLTLGATIGLVLGFGATLAWGLARYAVEAW